MAPGSSDAGRHPRAPAGWAELQAERAALLLAATTISGWEPHATAGCSAWRRASSTISAPPCSSATSASWPSYVEAERRGLARNRLLDVHLLGLVDAIARRAVRSDRAGPGLCRSPVVTTCAARSCRAGPVPPQARPPADRVIADRPAPSSESAPPARRPGPRPPGRPIPGQLFTDILLLAALVLPDAVRPGVGPAARREVEHPLRTGSSTATASTTPVLFNFVAARSEPAEIPDLSAFPGLAGSRLATAPHNLRWVYAAPLRDSGGTVLGVVAVLDRWLREASRREQRAMQAVTRADARPSLPTAPAGRSIPSRRRRPRAAAPSPPLPAEPEPGGRSQRPVSSACAGPPRYPRVSSCCAATRSPSSST